MTRRPLTNVSHSVRQRLLDLARLTGRPYGELEHYYAIERFLYRLAQSPKANEFVLKGALMLQAWAGHPARATRDIDLLGRGDKSVDEIIAAVRACIETRVPEDGIVFDPASVAGEEIRLEPDLKGVRVRFRGFLGKARLSLRLDVGFGDVVVPRPARIEYPEILDYGRPRLLGYSPESTIAEKYQAIVELEAANTRMKDFHDIWTLARRLSFKGQVLSRAIEATFSRRRSRLSSEVPLALTPSFFERPDKQAQWRAFLRKSGFHAHEDSFADAIRVLREFLLPPSVALVEKRSFRMTWAPGGLWRAQRPSASRKNGSN